MAKFLLHRIVSSLLVMWFIATLTFVLMHAVPGDPFTGEKKLPEQIRKNLSIKYALNAPLWKQYTGYMGKVVQGDLGLSLYYEGRSVNGIIRESFPVSATLGLAAITLSLCLGIPAGMLAAINHKKWPDYFVMFMSTAGVSVPGFILATLLVYIFAIKLALLPAALWGTPQQAILPALALSSLPAAFVARLTRSGMLEVLEQDYIKTARAKGLSETTVIFRHALKNTITPVVSYLGPLMAGILTGSFVVEQIFALPGLGKFFINSIFNRDYSIIMGVTLFYSCLLLILNLLVDLAYAWLDPRVQLRSQR